MILQKEFYFVWHGQINHNLLEGRDKGDHPDNISLNETGKNQAKLIQSIISTLPIKSIDFLIFLDTPPDIALARRIIRDYSSESNGDNLLKEIRNYLLITRPVYMASYNQKNQSDLILDGSLPLESLLSKVLDGLKINSKENEVV